MWLTEKRNLKAQLLTQGANLLIRVHTSVADQRVCMISDVVFSDCSSHRPSQTDYHNYTCRYPAQSAFRQRASDCNIVNYLIIMRKLSITHRVHFVFGIQLKRCSHYLIKRDLFVEIISTHRAWSNDLICCGNLLITYGDLHAQTRDIHRSS